MTSAEDIQEAGRLCAAVAAQDRGSVAHLLSRGASANVLVPFVKESGQPMRFPGSAPDHAPLVTAVGAALFHAGTTDLLPDLLGRDLEQFPVVAKIDGHEYDLFQFCLRYPLRGRITDWAVVSNLRDGVQASEDIVAITALAQTCLRTGTLTPYYSLGDSILDTVLPAPNPTGLEQKIKEGSVEIAALLADSPDESDDLATRIFAAIRAKNFGDSVTDCIALGAEFRPDVWSPTQMESLWNGILFDARVVSCCPDVPFAFSLVEGRFDNSLAALSHVSRRLDFARRWRGRTLLHHACASGATRIITWLLESGADACARVLRVGETEHVIPFLPTFEGMLPEEVARAADKPEAEAAVRSWKSRSAMKSATIARTPYDVGCRDF